MSTNPPEAAPPEPVPPEPPQADPQGMKDYYGNAPKPPEPPTGPECPPGTQPPKPVSPAAPPEEHTAYDQQKRDYEACVAGNPQLQEDFEAQQAQYDAAKSQYESEKSAYEEEKGPAPEPAPIAAAGGGGGGGGGKPAARIGDLTSHGGAIVAGFPQVLIGNMAAARVGDQATCTGPPDAIALGEFTVLIG